MRLLLTAVGIALLGLASRIEAERVFPFDPHDGHLGDWVDVVGAPAAAASDFVARPGHAPYDPASMDLRIWLAWHDTTGRERRVFRLDARLG